MEIEGKIIVKLDPMSGKSKAGNDWQKQEYVLETHEAYPKKVHFDFFGEKASQYPLEVGQEVRLSFDIESREYNGRWYTSIRGWKAEQIAAPGAQPAAAPMQAAPAPAPAPVPTPPFMNDNGNDGDLPF